MDGRIGRDGTGPEQPGRCRAQASGNRSRAQHRGVVTDVAGEFGAELVRAVRAGLAPSDDRTYSLSGISWYDFAMGYMRAQWPGRAATTRDETSEALTEITRALLWDIPGRPSEDVLHRALRAGRSWGPGQRRRGCRWRPG